MTDEQRHAAALADLDARPLTPEDLKRMKRTPRAKIIRRALGLSQEEFALRYHISIAHCAIGNRGGSILTPPRKCILAVIAHEPEVVRRALESPTPK
jgi:putative transcriptional regulator